MLRTSHSQYSAAAWIVGGALMVGCGLVASGCAPQVSAADSANATTACNTLGMSAQRFKLAQGYSLLYADADEVTQFSIEMKLKSASEPVGQLLDDYMGYNENLKDKLHQLADAYPAVRVDIPARSAIEKKTRFSIGKDYLLDFAPLVGDTGATFERKALLFFIVFVDSQRHLVALLADQESNTNLKQFLQQQHGQLDTFYKRFDSLLNKYYFKHPD